MKKTILFISPTGTLDNGAEISIVHLMEYLVQTGYTVINAIPDYHVSVQQDYMAKLAKKGIETLALSSVKWWWEDAPGGLPGTHNERVISYQENIAALRKIIADKQIELVITNTVNMFQGAVAAACENIPHFWLIHEFPNGEFGYYKEKLNFIIDYSQEIFAVRGALQKQLQGLLPEHSILSFAPFTQIIPTGNKEKDGAKRRIVSVGRLTERKNQLELIKAYAKLPQPIPDLVFIGAWDENYKKKCDIYIAEKGLKNVYFLGHRDDPWKEVTVADLAVFPSSMETFGLVYIEAIMNGIPTILSDNLGHLSAYEIFEEGQLYPSGDVLVLTEKIKQALASFDQLKENSLANLEKVRDLYTVQEVYHEVLEQIENSTFTDKNSLYHLKFLFDPVVSVPQSSTLFKNLKRKLCSIIKG